MLTLQQQTKILNFFCTLQAETFKEAECETVDFDGNKRDNYCELFTLTDESSKRPC